MILNRWLQVTVKATGGTGLVRPDVFCFGNLVGETGNSPTSFSVNAIDLGQVRSHQLEAASPTSPFEVNRDGRINAVDLGLTRAAQLRTLLLLTPPVGLTPPYPARKNRAAITL